MDWPRRFGGNWLRGGMVGLAVVLISVVGLLDPVERLAFNQQFRLRANLVHTWGRCLKTIESSEASFRGDTEEGRSLGCILEGADESLRIHFPGGEEGLAPGHGLQDGR